MTDTAPAPAPARRWTRDTAMDLVVSLALLALAIAYLVLSSQIELRREAAPGQMDARAWPMFLGVAAVALTYLAMQRFVDQRVALLAALLLAVNPWFVVYSRRLWLNALLPMFCVVFLWAFLRLAAAPAIRRSSRSSAYP